MAHGHCGVHLTRVIYGVPSEDSYKHILPEVVPTAAAKMVARIAKARIVMKFEGRRFDVLRGRSGVGLEWRGEE